MRIRVLAITFLLLSTASAFAASKKSKKDEPAPTSCVGFAQAYEFMGKKACVEGTVMHVGFSQAGTAFINFCDDRNKCPFTAVVFASDMQDVGDVKKLEGQRIQITGKVKDYKGTPEIVLRSRKQIGGNVYIPALPPEFSADRARATNLGQYKREDRRGRAW